MIGLVIRTLGAWAGLTVGGWKAVSSELAQGAQGFFCVCGRLGI